MITKPNNSLCGICGGPNNFFDDCGWFYVLRPTVHPSCTDYEIWGEKYESGETRAPDLRGFFVPTCGCVEIHTGER